MPALIHGQPRLFSQHLQFAMMPTHTFPFLTSFVSRRYQSYPSDVTTPIPGLEYRSITGSFAWRPRTFHHSKYFASVRLSTPIRNTRASASETWLTRSTSW